VLLDPKWVEDLVLMHPSDASQWRALDEEYYKKFGRDPRNIRLSASTDGLNPFGNQSSKHSTWSVFVWMYNIPLVVPDVMGHTYTKGYYLADDIYPRWSIFLKTHRNPTKEKYRRFAKEQEAFWKDVERAFGVLQSHWAIVRHPAKV
jgi:hypothetical protein